MKNKKILAILSSFLLALFFSLPWVICYIYFDLMLSALAIIIGYGAFKGYKMSIENLKVLYSYNGFRSAIIKDYSISFIFTLLGISLPVSNIKKALMTNNDNTDVDIKLINENTMLKNEIEYTRKIFEKKEAFSKNKTISKEEVLQSLNKEYNKLSKNIFLNFRFQHIIKKHNKEYYFNEKYASSTLKRTLYVFFKTLIIFSLIFIILLMLI